MIYYALSILMISHIREIIIISTERDMPIFQNLLGDGRELGLVLSYQLQDKPNGIAEALILSEKFLADSPSALILGDNIFYGNQLSQLIHEANIEEEGASIFTYQVRNPQRYGVAEIDHSSNKVISLEEKPLIPRSNHVVTGLYFYDKNAPYYAKNLSFSSRGELEITDLNKIYLAQGQLRAKIMGRGYAWFDMGTHKSLIDASQFIYMIEERQGIKIACLEEIAFLNGWISPDQLAAKAKKFEATEYGDYLANLVK
jgi:glucose-1-phosphate thymidylyltransferase